MMMTQQKKTDMVVANRGTIWTFEPVTDAASAWIADNVESEDWQWIGGALAVDQRLGPDLVAGLWEAGLGVEVRR